MTPAVEGPEVAEIIASALLPRDDVIHAQPLRAPALHALVAVTHEGVLAGPLPLGPVPSLGRRPPTAPSPLRLRVVRAGLGMRAPERGAGPLR